MAKIRIYGHFATDQIAAREEEGLAVSIQDAVAVTLLPYTTIEGIWKAFSLVTEANAIAIVPAPGLGHKDKIVKSKSGSTPHLVVKGFKYNCDDKCPYVFSHSCSSRKK